MKLFSGKKIISTGSAVILGFMALILIGTFLLALPISQTGELQIFFVDALFTSVSAVCVTGLAVVDTAACWSGFGQAVILVMIQAGGLGIVFVTLIFSFILGKKISLSQRNSIQDTLAAPTLGGIVRTSGFILKGIALIELSGAVLMMPPFIRDHGIKGIWYAVFHSVSAFCNAGFDLMGRYSGEFSSLTSYRTSVLINVAVILLILTGGLGFSSWADIKNNGLRFRKMSLQTRVILLVSVFIIIIPALYFFLWEYRDLALGERLLSSLFSAVTPRTAGFSTTDCASLSDTGKAMTIFLMIIGGAPGSTAGGIKITCFAVLVANMVSVVSRDNDVSMLGRRVEPLAVRKASMLLCVYVTLGVFSGMFISSAEGIPLLDSLFETFSAICTVGLSVGITASLSQASRIILMILMFTGRIGILTLIFAGKRPMADLVRTPLETISVG